MLFEYFSNSWVLICNLVVLGLGLLITYDWYAKALECTTGKYQVKGKITYCEFVEPAFIKPFQGKKISNSGIISYKYFIDGQLYTGIVPPEKLTKEEVGLSYFKGSEVNVFYSPKSPSFSFVNKVPSKVDLFVSIANKWIVVPFLGFNLFAFSGWFLTYLNSL